MRLPARLVVYGALLVGAALFILPFVWMLVTALKPIDQALSDPHAWLPRRYAAVIDGQDQEVRLGALAVTPGVWARPSRARQAVLLPAEAVSRGIWTPAAGRPVAVTVIKEVPATLARPWREVVSLDGLHDDILPATAVRSWVAFRWENFPRAIAAMHHFSRYLANTLLLCVLNVIGTVLSSALVAYGFARLEWRGRDGLFAVLLATMMIPFPVTMVPLYALFRALGMVGTLQPLWVGSFCANAFNVFLLRQFFRTIPKELSEAARIDGCSELRIFWTVVLPLCKPALVVVALFTFLGVWNDFLGPLIYLTNEHDFTLALGLAAMKQSESGATEWPYLMAASTLVILPVIALFLAAQRSFVEGITVTGMKN